MAQTAADDALASGKLGFNFGREIMNMKSICGQ